RTPTGALRGQLLAVHGIGPETADSILLYAGEHPVFVIDAYTRRILERHALADPKRSYEDLRGLFETTLPRDPQLFNEYHALIVHLRSAHLLCDRARSKHPAPLGRAQSRATRRPLQIENGPRRNGHFALAGPFYVFCQLLPAQSHARSLVSPSA